LGLQEAKGALIAEAQPGSPAKQAGLKAGDVIVSIDGNAIKDSRDLARKVADEAPGKTVTIAYVRGGKQATVQVTIRQMKDEAAPRVASKGGGQTDRTEKLGLTVAPASEVEGAGAQGLAVVQVAPGGKGAELGFAAGDVILKAGGQTVDGIQTFEKAVQSADAAGKKNVLVLVRRGDSQRYVAVPVSVG
jgi:serine protease Do